MKRFLLSLVLAVSVALAAIHPVMSGPMTLLGAGKPSAGGGCGDSNVIAWKAAVITAGGTLSTGRETVVCTLVATLKANGSFAVSDRIWLLASENAQQASIDLVNLATTTLVNAPSFVADQGYTGDTSTSYINSNFNPGSGTPNYSRNSAAVHGYIRNSRSSGGNSYYLFGAQDSVSTGWNSFIQPFFFSLTVHSLNANSAATAANANAQGFWSVNRTAASGAGAGDLYHNSSSTPVSTDTAVSIASPSMNFFIGANNLNGTPTQFSGDQIAIIAFTAGMSAANIARFQNDLNCYMTAIGTNVYTSSPAC